MPAVSDLQLEPHQAVEGDERAEIRITMPHLPSTGGTRGSDCLQALLLGRGGPGVASSHGKSPGPMNARAPYADSPLVYSSHFCFPRKRTIPGNPVSSVRRAARRELMRVHSRQPAGCTPKCFGSRLYDAATGRPVHYPIHATPPPHRRACLRVSARLELMCIGFA